MLKEKMIVGILDQNRTLLMNFRPKKLVLEMLAELLCPYNFHDSSIFKNLKIHPEKWVWATIPFFKEEDEAGFLILKENFIQIILLKDSKYFRSLEKNLYNKFDLLDYPKP